MNEVILKGEVAENPVLSYSCKGIDFYIFNLKITRNSGVDDFIPIHMAGKSELNIGDFIEINGTYRSYNKQENDKSRLVLYVLLNKYKKLEEKEYSNSVILEGTLCKKPVYRQTLFGREIADALLAVNRKYNRSDYIPLIFWSKAACSIKDLEIGQKLSIKGRIQSRIYTKNKENKIAYEVSVQTFEKLGDISN